MKNDQNIAMSGQKFNNQITSRSIVQATRLHKSNDIKRPTSTLKDIHAVSHKHRGIRQQIASKTSQLSPRPVLREIGRNIDFARNSSVVRFAKNISNSATSPTSKAVTKDIGASRHPLSKKVDSIHSQKIAQSKQTLVTKTPKEIKEAAIAEVFSKLAAHEQHESSARKRKSKIVNVISIIVGIIFLIAVAYIIYTNIPALSVNIANAQAGINATFPEYKPEGYVLAGPASCDQGEVSIKFRSNDNQSSFVIKQSKSSWDSSAVKNKVAKDSNGQFITTEERGLTIFTYNGNASWVNGGILYNIAGDAQLSGDQIRRIATSL